MKFSSTVFEATMYNSEAVFLRLFYNFCPVLFRLSLQNISYGEKSHSVEYVPIECSRHIQWRGNKKPENNHLVIENCVTYSLVVNT